MRVSKVRQTPESDAEALMIARRILKNAELHILRDVELWKFHASSWSQTQDTLRRLRNELARENKNCQES